MQAGTIEWNGIDLSRVGKPSLTIRRVPDPPPPAQATRELVTLTVRVALTALDPSTLQARLEFLQASMKAAEGDLRALSPGGHTLAWNATPAGDNLTEAIAGRTAVVELEFMSVESHESTAALVAASFTPDGAAGPIPLHAIREWREVINTDHHSPIANFRRATTVTLTFTARVMQANPADTPNDRMAALLAKEAELRALDCRQGTLVHAGQTHIVRVQSLSPQIDEGRHALDLAIQCSYRVFPGDSTSEANFEIETRSGVGEERIISISGTVEAESEEHAKAKIDAIRARHTTAGRTLISSRYSAAKADGGDTAGNESFTGTLPFSMEFREIAADATRWTLKVTSRQDARAGMRYSYTGTVKAATAAAALAKARALGGNADHPFRVGAEETIDTASAPDSADSQFISLSFSYEYEGPASGFLFAEISSDRSKPMFSEWQTTVSGSITAPTTAAARTFMTSLLTAYAAKTHINESERESEMSMTLGDAANTRAAMRLDFSRTYPDTHTRLAAKYTEETETDYESMTTTTTISGSIFSNTRANAEAGLAALLLATLPLPQRISTSHPQEKVANEGTFAAFNGSSRWIQLDFSASKTTKVAGAVGFDVIEASYTASRTGAVNRSAINLIPFNRPVAQTGVSWTVPSFRISGTCKARVQASARSFVQTLRNKAPAGTGGTRHEDEPQESLTAVYEKFSNANVLFYVFTGNYGFSYTGVAGMDGIWTADV